MRFLLLAVILILAACGSAATPAPTATAIPPTEAPTGAPVSTGENPLAALAATVIVPEAGTLSFPSNLDTPDAATPVPIIIDQLGFNQTGGIAGDSLTIILHGDGTLIRDGKTSKVSQKDVDNLAMLLNNIHFFDMNGIFTGPGASPDTYRYTIAVQSGGRSRMITSQDGLTPPELSQLYDAIRSLANS